jgi:4-oxalocrotonate tautomerase
MPEVYIHAIEGRSIEQKRALAKDVTEAVAKHFNSPPESIMVDFVDIPKHNKAKGGVLFSDR